MKTLQTRFKDIERLDSFIYKLATRYNAFDNIDITNNVEKVYFIIHNLDVNSFNQVLVYHDIMLSLFLDDLESDYSLDYDTWFENRTETVYKATVLKGILKIRYIKKN